MILVPVCNFDIMILVIFNVTYTVLVLSCSVSQIGEPEYAY